MAAGYIKFDDQKNIPRNIKRGVGMVNEAIAILVATKAAMLQMRDGDGSDAAHYDLLATEGGYSAGDYASANAAAKASFDELDSMLFKMTTDSQVDSVMAARLQVAAKHGIV